LSLNIWNDLPSLNQKALPFEQQYQPAGWANHYQVSLGFENTRTMGIFNIPAGKDFVNLAGADWLQNVYAAAGWHCFLEDDESALAFSYRPGGREETIAFSLDYLGNVRLSALNTKKAILYTSGVLSLAFDDDTVTPTHLIVAAPVVLNETSLVTEQLQIFTQKHENHGGYEVEQGDIKAKHTINRSSIKAIEKFNVHGHTWKNLADITGEGPVEFHLDGLLDNHEHTISARDKLTILADSIDNEQGTITGEQVILDLKHSLNNVRGKILSDEKVTLHAKKLFSKSGLIRSPKGLDFRNVGHVDVGGIETHGDVRLREGHFTMTTDTAIGNADLTVGNEIKKLIIEKNHGLLEQLSIELLGTIKAKTYHAHRSTSFGPDVKIAEVEADRGSKLTFTPGQIKRLKTRMKDNPLASEFIKDLERLEWLLEDEADVLPYDVNMSGQLVMRTIPDANIPKWPITKNVHASKGLELHLLKSDIIMGDGEGKTYPEWIADTGPFHMYGKTIDQKSGFFDSLRGICIFHL
jgi:adhesin HecA-like repeat protein